MKISSLKLSEFKNKLIKIDKTLETNQTNSVRIQFRVLVYLVINLKTARALIQIRINRLFMREHTNDEIKFRNPFQFVNLFCIQIGNEIEIDSCK